MHIHKKSPTPPRPAGSRKDGKYAPPRQGYYPGRPSPRCLQGRKGTRKPAFGKLSILFANRRRAAFLLAGAALALAGVWLVCHWLVRDISQRQAQTAARAIYHQAAEADYAGAAPGMLPAAISEADKPPAPVLTAGPDPSAAGALRSFITPHPHMIYLAGDRFSSLRKLNDDIVGWLEIKGMVDLPVLKRDNTYYLTHDYLGKKSASGALFLDMSMDIYPPNETLVIHGHNMRDGSMFGRLPKYREKSFYTSHWLIHFDTLFESGEYAVFAALNVSTRAADPSYFPYIYSGFESDDQFNAYIGLARQRSVFRSGIDVAPSDALLMLSTCHGGEDSYFLVIARKIRPGESLSALQEACLFADFL